MRAAARRRSAFGVAALTIGVAWAATSPLSQAQPAGLVEADVDVDVAEPLHAVSPLLFGFNVSHDQLTDDLVDDGRLARLLRSAGTGLLRYPGGEESSYFHWERPDIRGFVDAWDPPVEPGAWNHVLPEAAPGPTPFMDTDEFVAFARRVGAEPLLGVNVESGVKNGRAEESLAEAVRWVRHCRRRGHRVRYWSVDNESNFDSPHNHAFIPADQYARLVRTYSQAMKAVDPEIRIVANLMGKPSDAAFRTLFDEAGGHFDVVDVHHYWLWGRSSWDEWLARNPMGDYADEIRAFRREQAASAHPVELAYLEWNVAPNAPAGDSPFQLALMQAEMLGLFMEGGLHAACLWPLRWPVAAGTHASVVTRDGLQPTPLHPMLQLYARARGARVVPTRTNAPSVRAVAAISAGGRVVRVFLLHKSQEGVKGRATLRLAGARAISARAESVTAASLADDRALLVRPAPRRGATAGEWEVDLPPHSLTLVTVRCASELGR